MAHGGDGRGTRAVAEQAGIRALLTYPIDTGADTYFSRCFISVSSRVREEELFLLLTDARRVFQLMAEAEARKPIR